MGKLTFSVRKVLGKDKMRKIFHMKSHKTKYDLSDAIKRETVEYQVEKMRNYFFDVNATDSNTGRQQTYWCQAYAIAGIDLEEENSVSGNELKRIDEYWLKVWFKLVFSGKTKFSRS